MKKKYFVGFIAGKGDVYWDFKHFGSLKSAYDFVRACRRNKYNDTFIGSLMDEEEIKAQLTK